MTQHRTRAVFAALALALGLPATSNAASFSYADQSETVTGFETGYATSFCEGADVIGGGFAAFPVSSGSSAPATAGPTLTGYTYGTYAFQQQNLPITSRAVCTSSGAVTRKLVRNETRIPVRTKNVDGSPVAVASGVVKCPSKARVVGGGVLAPTSGDPRDAGIVEASYPVNSRGTSGWKGVFQKQNDFGRIKMVAICVKRSSFAKSVRYTDDDATVQPEGSNTALADCGQRTVIGGGFSYPLRPLGWTNTSLSISVDDDADGMPDDAWAAATKNSIGDDAFRLTAYAICA